MGVNRDAANDVYTPLHFTRVVASPPEAIPTGDSDGISCLGYNILFLSTVLLTATTHQYELYFYDGAAWKLVEDSSLLLVADFDPAADHEQHYNLSTIVRFALRLVSADGDVRVTTNIGI